ncbi:MAG TPA: HRDC domain-containing protein, partial [Gemmatimonadales bacterium]|nr:HRDC domain-containing protein [Gemmatimonadales bacterium]
RAIARLEAMVAYAAGGGCYRARLVRYFGEALAECAGCARCARRDLPAPLDDAARIRFRALRTALAPVKTPWGGAVLEPEVLARLAETPPADAATLAAIPGVGPELTARFGGRILEALGVVPDPAPLGASGSGLEARLLAWRAARAGAEGVPPWQVLTDAAVRQIVAARPLDRAALTATIVIGPRALAAFGDELTALVAATTGADGDDPPL